MPNKTPAEAVKKELQSLDRTLEGYRRSAIDDKKLVRDDDTQGYTQSSKFLDGKIEGLEGAQRAIGYIIHRNNGNATY